MSGLFYSTKIYGVNYIKYVCDGTCHKAWGISCRPTKKLSDNEDDIFFIGDDELKIAPDDPGTREGGEFKVNIDFTLIAIHNKWCIRQCERIVHVNSDIDASEDQLREQAKAKILNKLKSLKLGWYNIPRLESNSVINDINEL